jgi:hypothetical protein
MREIGADSPAFLDVRPFFATNAIVLLKLYLVSFEFRTGGDYASLEEHMRAHKGGFVMYRLSFHVAILTGFVLPFLAVAQDNPKNDREEMRRRLRIRLLSRHRHALCRRPSSISP